MTFPGLPWPYEPWVCVFGLTNKGPSSVGNQTFFFYCWATALAATPPASPLANRTRNRMKVGANPSVISKGMTSKNWGNIYIYIYIYAVFCTTTQLLSQLFEHGFAQNPVDSVAFSALVFLCVYVCVVVVCVSLSRPCTEICLQKESGVNGGVGFSWRPEDRCIYFLRLTTLALLSQPIRQRDPRVGPFHFPNRGRCSLARLKRENDSEGNWWRTFNAPIGECKLNIKTERLHRKQQVLGTLETRALPPTDATVYP